MPSKKSYLPDPVHVIELLDEGLAPAYFCFTAEDEASASYDLNLNLG
jgi:hypothetical protein